MILAGLVVMAAGAVLAGGAAGGGSPRILGLALIAAGAVLLSAGGARRFRRRSRGGALPGTDVAAPRSGPRGRRGSVPIEDFRNAVYRTGKGRIAAMIIAAVYIVSPIDFIPDFLLPIGVADDAAVLGWLLFAGGQELSRRRAMRTVAGGGAGVPPEITASRRRSPR